MQKNIVRDSEYEIIDNENESSLRGNTVKEDDIANLIEQDNK